MKVWAIVISQWCNSWGFYVLLNWTPLYFYQVLEVNIGDQGLFLSFPYLAQLVISIIIGFFADYLISVQKFSQTKLFSLLIKHSTNSTDSLF